MTKALVTGASGFIGGHIARALLRHGYAVRALLRKESDARNLAGLDVEPAFGDLRDRTALDDAMRGCDALVHAAAAYSFWTPRPATVYESNVQGTANVLGAALVAGVGKVVYTSTESCVGVPPGGLGTEDLFAQPRNLGGHYQRSKLEAERVALGMCARGLPLVVVNPTMPVGSGDLKPTPTGQFIVDFLTRRMPAYVDTGLNVVDVEDVAEGHVLALERGRAGQRYLLGNQNLTLKAILDALAGITDSPAPKLRIPISVALAAAYADEAFEGRLLRRRPRIPLAGVQVARTFRYFDCSKAVRELGLPQTPIKEALAKAVRWFQEHGYVR